MGEQIEQRPQAGAVEAPKLTMEQQDALVAAYVTQLEEAGLLPAVSQYFFGGVDLGSVFDPNQQVNQMMRAGAVMTLGNQAIDFMSLPADTDIRQYVQERIAAAQASQQKQAASMASAVAAPAAATHQPAPQAQHAPAPTHAPQAGEAQAAVSFAEKERVVIDLAREFQSNPKLMQAFAASFGEIKQGPDGKVLRFKEGAVDFIYDVLGRMKGNEPLNVVLDELNKAKAALEKKATAKPGPATGASQHKAKPGKTAPTGEDDPYQYDNAVFRPGASALTRLFGDWTHDITRDTWEDAYGLANKIGSALIQLTFAIGDTGFAVVRPLGKGVMTAIVAAPVVPGYLIGQGFHKVFNPKAHFSARHCMYVVNTVAHGIGRDISYVHEAVGGVVVLATHKPVARFLIEHGPEFLSAIIPGGN